MLQELSSLTVRKISLCKRGRLQFLYETIEFDQTLKFTFLPWETQVLRITELYGEEV